MTGTPVTFGPFAFDPARWELRRGGVRVALGRRAALLLASLVEAGGATVGKDELLARGWPECVVGEGNLTVQIAALRKLLGPGPADGDWIVTVPRVGYRLAVPCASDGPATTWTAAVPALAVLAFRNPGGRPADDLLVEGMLAEIVTVLSRFRSFAVVSGDPVPAFAGRDTTAREFARDPDVRYVLAGSLWRAGDRIRVNVQLVDGATGRHLRAERFEDAGGDAFALQARVAARLAHLVAPAVEAAEIDRSRRERPFGASVYHRHLRARALLADETVEGNAAAHALLEEALAIDPDHPVILAHAAWALEHRSTMGWPSIGADDRQRCVDLARRALRHADGDAQVMAECGMALVQTGRDYDGGMAVIEAAAAANPDDPFVAAVAAVATLHCGDLDDAALRMEDAVRRAPHDPDARFALTGLAMIDLLRGEYEKALALATRSLAINARFDATYWMLIAANALLGRTGEARRHLAALSSIAPGVTISSLRAGQPAKHPERIGVVLDGLRLAGMPER